MGLKMPLDGTLMYLASPFSGYLLMRGSICCESNKKGRRLFLKVISATFGEAVRTSIGAFGVGNWSVPPLPILLMYTRFEPSPSDIRIHVWRGSTEGDTAMGSGDQEEAINPYSVVLSQFHCSRSPSTQAKHGTGTNGVVGGELLARI
jgi:hypothetical protein